MSHRRRRRTILPVLALLVSAYVLTALIIVLDGLADEKAPADVAVVLGNTVHPDGTPSARLAARLDKALELYQEGLVGTILVSGGLGKEGHDEAVVMKEYLLEREVPEDRVHVDSNGTNTFQTARNAQRFLKANGLSTAIVVSQYFHVPRARLAFRRCGVPRVYAAHADHFEWRDLYAVAREVVAYYAYCRRTPPE